MYIHPSYGIICIIPLCHIPKYVIETSDYLASPSLPLELTLSRPRPESCFSLTVINDNEAEGTEELVLQLSNVGTAGAILSPDQLTITIRDDDLSK